MNNPINAPTENGIYWARTRGFQWWNLIVAVSGIPPFLQTTAVWKWAEASLVINMRLLHEIHEFGPKIDYPPEPTVTKEEKN